MEISAYEIGLLKPITNSRHKGNFGACYLFFENAIKYLDTNNRIFNQIDVEKRLQRLTKVKVGGVSLPLELIYVDKKFSGYIMPYYNGPTLRSLLLQYRSGKINISRYDLNEIYISLRKKLEKLSSYRVIANDIKPDNIIYYDGDFKLVDCDFYRIDDKLSYSDILEKNIKLLNDAFNKILNDYFNR